MVGDPPELTPPRRGVLDGVPRWQQALAAAALVVTLLAGAVILLSGDDGDGEVASGDSTSSTVPTSDGATVPATSSSTTTPAPPIPADPGPEIESRAGDHGELRAVLEVARQRWQAVPRPGGYRYRTQRQCFCAFGDNVVTVGPDGVVTGQETLAGAAEATPPTIDELFDGLRGAIDADAFLIRVSFDQRFGYPVTSFVDLDESIADEEDGRSVSWLALVPG